MTDSAIAITRADAVSELGRVTYEERLSRLIAD